MICPSHPAARLGRTLLAASAVVGVAAAPAAAAQSSSKSKAKTVKVKSTPANVVYGGFPISRGPISTVEPGQTVKIDALSSVGFTTPGVSPVDYFAKFGVPADEVLQDGIDFWNSIPTRTKYAGVHIMTGPVDIAGAEPGDTLEIEVLDMQTRVPYGVTLTAPDSGVFGTTYPGYRPGDSLLDIPPVPAHAAGGIVPGERQHLMRTGVSKSKAFKGKEVTFFGDGIEVPLQKFMGIMAVKPADNSYVGYTPNAAPYPDGVQSSVPPGPYGGNLDVRDLTIGSKLYLPVFQKGAGFYIGDSHSAQGDGEVNITANEQSLTGTFKFKVHKGRKTAGPFAEDKDHWLVMGIDHDLDRALKLSVRNTVDWLKNTKGLTTARAYALAGMAINFTISEAVDRTQVVTARIPKEIFLKNGKVSASKLAAVTKGKKSTISYEDDGHQH